MLETPEARAELRRDLEAWPQYQPVASQKMFELLDMVERLEKEADWLANQCAKACKHKAEDCAFQSAWIEDKPHYGENCKRSFCSLDKSDWREAARESVAEEK